MRAWQKIITGGAILLVTIPYAAKAAALGGKKMGPGQFYGFFNPAPDTARPVLKFSSALQVKTGAAANGTVISNGEACRAVITASNIFLEAGNTKGALELLSKAMLEMPGMPDLFELRGYACLLAGNFRQAASDYNRAIELDPNEALYYIGLGSALAIQNDLKGAKKAFRRALNAADKDKRMSREDRKSLKDEVKQLLYDLEEGGNGD